MILRLLALLAALLPAPAYAWWEYGHETTARVAERQMSPRARAEVARLLRAAPPLATPTCPLRTLADASVWPDCIKRLSPRWAYAFSWHYQNVDICRPFDLKAACRDGNCVSAQVDRQAKLLGDRRLPARERLEALAFLTHFVGDLHTPLHAGDKGDLGGNRQRTSYGIVTGARLNLHTVWDGYLAERAISTAPADATGLLAGYSPAERAAMALGTTEDWSRESWAVARDFAYATALGGEPCKAAVGKLDDKAIEALIAPTRLQIVRGGLRLARLLDEALNSPSPSP